ncbi:hypothetical protein [Microbacterium sulfonylureivorans]|uniref:hypothetical protein n=1 Tax=Microbacterium sulfonylureivorans TaxID=2486854 RepID=UPI000FDB8FFB|nr:hypothetical protein [Microbacterium sulfonylureivorans]
MASIDGRWAIEIATLAGSRRFDLTLATVGTSLTGTAVGATGPIPIRNGTATADSAEFRLDVAAPVPSTLVLALRVDGDRLTGTATPGPFPPMSVVGVRTR